MLTFRLKYLFCFVLVVGVALMWRPWANGTDETANRLLEIRENLKTVPKDVFDYHERIGISAGLPDETDVSEAWVRKYGFHLWMDTELWLVEPDVQHRELPPQVDLSARWIADWPVIEAKASEENWTFYRQVIVTVLAVLTLGWLVWPWGWREGGI